MTLELILWAGTPCPALGAPGFPWGSSVSLGNAEEAPVSAQGLDSLPKDHP